MRNRRDDERYGYGRDDFDRFRDRDYDRDVDRDRAWSRDEDMGGSHWSGASGRGGYQGRGGHGGYGGYGYGGYDYGHGGGWGGGFGGGEREYGGMNRYDRVYGRRDFGDDDYERRDFERRDFERDYDDRPRNLGARDYETRHFGGVGGGGSGFGPMGRQRMQSPLGGRGGMGIGSGSDLGFSYRGHEGREDLDERGPHYGKGPKGYKRTDDRIREEVCECIARQGHIDASDVEVKVENGTVILTGTVAQRHHKRVLEQMVERVHGVDDVHNELRLKRDESVMRSSQNGDQQPRSSSQMPNGKNARA